jgi:thiol-disulfide isomerase/thioredoxin
MRRGAIWIVGVAIAWMGAAALHAAASHEGGELIGTTALTWDVADWFNSWPLSLEQLRGRVVLVRWWTGPECPYCAASAPNLNALHERYHAKGLVVIGFYHHKSPTPLTRWHVEQLVERYRFQFPVAIDPEWRTLKRWWLDAHSTNGSGCSSLLCYLKQFHYLRYLLLLVVVAKAVSTVIDYQFNGLVELAMAGKEARTALFGLFYTVLNVTSLAVQLLLTSRLFNRLGVRRSLAVLPVGLAVGLIGLLIIPGIAVAGLVALYDRSLNYSLGQTGKEVLYVSVPSEVRYQVKPLIDAAAFRLAQGLAGAGLLLAQHLGHLPPQAFGFLAFLLIVIWWLAIHRLQAVQPAWVQRR